MESESEDELIDNLFFMQFHQQWEYFRPFKHEQHDYVEKPTNREVVTNNERIAWYIAISGQFGIWDKEEDENNSEYWLGSIVWVTWEVNHKFDSIEDLSEGSA